ncbi:MAG: hypothetical protein UW24_C0012G0054 [Parcubacteria group bacterium GW2011_GWA2_44_12]|nr:MAG: hypothetical protein UW24_C0012G0054 [Parcubacteria group bacterium GW2011_GWA2_44_12]
MTKSEPFLSGTDGALRAPKAQRSGEAGRKRGVGKMNTRLALAFAAAKIRISQSEIRHQEKICCACPARPCAHNRFFTP